MLKLGTATQLITPVEIEKLNLQGMARTCTLRGVMDDIEVNVFYFDDGAKQVIICVVDAVFVHKQLQDAIEEALQLPHAMLMLTCIHDHSASASALDKSNQEHVSAAEAARALVQSQCIAAINRAQQQCVAVEVGATRVALEQPMGTNRRAKLDNGCCVTAWGAGPSIPPGSRWIDYSGPDADWIDLVVFKAVGSDNVSAIISSYGSHIHFYEVPMITGEGGGNARKLMREQFNADVLYATSYAGDVSLQFHHPMPAGEQEQLIEWQRSGSRAFAQRFTQSVAEALPSISFSAVEELSMESMSWQSDRGHIGEMYEHYLIQTLRLGTIALCSLPGEMFLDWDAQLRDQLPCDHLLVLGYNISWLGYVATPLGFEEGSYECMRGPADKLGYGEALLRVKSSTTTGDEIIQNTRQQIQALFT